MTRYFLQEYQYDNIIPFIHESLVGQIKRCPKAAALDVSSSQNENRAFTQLYALGEVFNEGTSRNPIPFLQTELHPRVTLVFQLNAKLLHGPLVNGLISRIVDDKGIIDGAVGGKPTVSLEFGQTEVVDVPNIPKKEMAGDGEREDAKNHRCQ